MRRATAQLLDVAVLAAGFALGERYLTKVSSVSSWRSPLLVASYPLITTLFGGRTLGKAVVGIRVVSRGGERLRLHQALVRDLGRGPLIVLAPRDRRAAVRAALVLADNAVMLFDPAQRAAHDFAAGTRVVVER
jgi:uncharacterized RDD family membrane protein YckC